VALKEKEEVRW